MTYSSTLDGAITADTTDVFVAAAPTAPYPPFVQVGSELMAVVSVQPMAQYPVAPGSRVHLAVQRGALGTTRATHSDAAAIYAVTPVVQTSAPSAPPASEVGAPQSLSLLGPYTLAYNTPGLVWTGAGIAGVELSDDLQAGTIVDAWVINRIDWTGPNNPTYALVVGIGNSVPYSADMYEAADATLRDNGVAAGTQSRAVAAAIPYPSSQTIARLLVQSTGKLRAILFVNAGDAPTAGETDVYAIIATPA